MSILMKKKYWGSYCDGRDKLADPGLLNAQLWEATQKAKRTWLISDTKYHWLMQHMNGRGAGVSDALA